MIKRSDPVRHAYCLRAQQHLRQLSLILLTSLLLFAHTTETEGAEHGGHHIYHGTYTGARIISRVQQQITLTIQQRIGL